jgi:leucyl-tRNA synthetase
MRKELSSLGLSFSKEREFATSDNIYTKFEQEIIIKMYESGLIYRKAGMLNWCPHDHTVLANEQVEDGKCWRCGTTIELKEMFGYYINITKYAKELLDDLKTLQNGWPKQVLTMQENWIGRSEGLEFEFLLTENSHNIVGIDRFLVFTTRADTIYGITYCSLSSEHPIVLQLLNSDYLTNEQKEKIKNMQKIAPKDRGAMEKDGFYLGLDAVHPLTNELIPIWVANFVISDYGSGAVMSVPAHDQRDYEFAKKFDLPIKAIMDCDISESAYSDSGNLINSYEFNGINNITAKTDIIQYFEKLSIGKKVINYRLRDWGVSRQRYWGTPIPLIHCEKCGIVAETDLPVILPEDVEITGEGNPLEKHPTWKYEFHE